MKQILLLLLTLTLSCSKDEETQIDQLPAITTVGANTAGCLVNGRVFLPKRNGSTLGQVLSCFYQFVDGGYHLGLAITEKGTNENKTVGISLNPSQLIEGNTYNLGEQTTDGTNYNSNFGEYRISSNSVSTIWYLTTNINIGELKIIKLDTQQKIISGTFWYDAVNSNGEKIEIRDGRFDMRYVN